MMRNAVLLALAAVVSGGPAAGQAVDVGAGAAADTVIRLGTVEATVTRGALAGDRVPFAISVVRSHDLHPAMPAVDLHEVLRRVPGVVVSNRHNLAMDTRIAVRGFGARSAFGVRGVRILLDGIPLTLPDGQAALTNVDPASIGRIEVLRGPAAALYGNAAGGVISMTTMEPPPGGLLEASVATSTYGTDNPANLVRLQANAGGLGSTDSWFVGVSHLSSEGFRDHSRARRTGLSARYRRQVGERSVVTTVLNAASVPVAQNPGALSLDSARLRPRMAWPQNVATAASKEVTQVQGGASFTHHFGGALVELAAYGLDRSMDNPLAFGRFIRLDRTGAGARLMVRAPDDVPVHWTAGVEVQSQSDDRIERDNESGEMTGATYQDRVDRVASVAPFAFGQLPILSGLAARGGVRYDAVVFDSRDRMGETPAHRSARRVLDAWSGSAGLIATLGPAARTWGSVSTWFQTPTTTELINTPPSPGETCCPTGFNPDLEPQDGRGWEVGVGGEVGLVQLEVVGFDLRVRNEILPYQVEGIPGREFFRNAGKSTHRGLEVSALAGPYRGWRAGLGYAYSAFRFTEPENPTLAGNRLPGIPPHRLEGRVGWSGRGASFWLEGEWLDRTPADDANTAAAPSYGLIDVRASREFTTPAGRVEPFVAVTNILGARYSASLVINAFGGRYHEPGPGRALLVGARARFR